MNMSASPFERRLSDFGLAESVRLLGVRHDIDRLMLGSRLLLFPSRAEGLGMVAVEAKPQDCRSLPPPQYLKNVL